MGFTLLTIDFSWIRKLVYSIPVSSDIIYICNAMECTVFWKKKLKHTDTCKHFPNEVFVVYVYNCTSAFNFASDLNTYFL